MPTIINVASISCILALPECPMAGWRSSGTRFYISCVLCKLPRQEQDNVETQVIFWQGRVEWVAFGEDSGIQARCVFSPWTVRAPKNAQ
jgi:hypothetical protein